MVNIIFSDGQILPFDETRPLSEALRDRGLEQPCGGRGICGKCKVYVSGPLSPVTRLEQSSLSARELEDGVRLACQTYALGDVRIHTEAPGEAVILTGGQLPEFVRAPETGGLGLAVDVGTTTLAAYLFALEGDCPLLAQASARNPQVTFGADVISRIQLSMQGKSADLQASILQAIDSLARETAGSRLRELSALVITGNTAMLYLLTAEDPTPLSAAPFTLTRSYGEMHTAGELGLSAVPAGARVYLCPAVSAYVGGDIASAALSTRIASAGDNTLMIDIGTNGEMVLCSGGKLLCCSTAAGPAFEGAGLSCGSSAVSGAVSRVWLEGSTLRYSVIGGGQPRSICGSGVIDALAALLALEAVDETGRLDEEVCETLGILTEAADGPAARIAGDVVLTQKDIRSVQLAKAAICAGALTLMEHCGVTSGTLSQLLIAGGFGYYMDVSCAEAIGLIPAGTAAKARIVGNAAGMGACMALLSGAERQETERLARAMETVPLYDDAFFRDQYIECMMFE